MCKFAGRCFLCLLVLGGSLKAEEAEDLDLFFRSISDGRQEVVYRLINNHPDWVDREIYLGLRPLYRASVLGRAEIVDLLLKKGADVTLATDGGTYPLHAACQNGHVAIVQLLLAAGAKVDVQDLSGESALHLACRHKREKVIPTLLEYRAQLNLVNEQGQTPLHLAAGLGNYPMVILLTEAGADLNVVDKRGFSPLGWTRELKRNGFGDVGGYLEARGAKELRPESSSVEK